MTIKQIITELEREQANYEKMAYDKTISATNRFYYLGKEIALKQL